MSLYARMTRRRLRIETGAYTPDEPPPLEAPASFGHALTGPHPFWPSHVITDMCRDCGMPEEDRWHQGSEVATDEEEPATDPLCPATLPRDPAPWMCTLRAGHDGRHEAHGSDFGGRELITWNDNDPAPEPQPELQPGVLGYVVARNGRHLTHADILSRAEADHEAKAMNGVTESAYVVCELRATQ